MRKSYQHSPNFSRGRTSKVTAIAIHWFDDPAKKPSLSGVVSWFQNPASQVSAHWVVSEDQAVQMVQEHDTAWATAAANPYTIAIEIDPQLTERTYQTVGALVREIRSRHGNLPLKRHRDLVGGTICPGHTDLAKIERYATNAPQGGTNVASDKTINQVYEMGLNRAPDAGGRATYRKTTDAVLVDSIYTSGERATILKREAAQRAQATANAKALATAKAQLASLSSRPTKAELDAAMTKIAEAEGKAQKTVEKKDAEIAELNKEIAALKVVPPHVETENKTVLIGLTESLMDFIKTLFRR